MILVLDAVLLAFILGLATRGRLTSLASLRLRGEVLLAAGLVLQLLLPRLIPLGIVPDRVAVLVFWAVPSALLLIALLANSQSLGLATAGIGVGLNMLVVLLNLGMPVSLSAGAIVGFEVGPMAAQIQASWLHVPLSMYTRLALLSDVLPIPGPNWHRGMASIGDVMLAAGVAHLVFCRMHLAAPSTNGFLTQTDDG